ncbi:flagellar biosynthetic protein FliQ [Tautonia plasticadhaerens]|uniref:Flagellar biosynthetic protein FliQ n=1 Tax=Tautonia plasticadhaerens TaxID=2527974 RepID=A0A518HCU5_9BACT|nr:flagellar biosynthetic protein FliQ [Tautonia plasticadhaerens]QDV38685.1 Flagellar biosynthetic protein FliQ [Tautonia plasticadhaerens]
MGDAVLIGATREAVRLALLLAAGPLGAALVVGLLAALGQAMTQMNEPTVGLVARLLAVAAVTVLLLPWLLARWLDFAAAALGGFPELL